MLNKKPEAEPAQQSFQGKIGTANTLFVVLSGVAQDASPRLPHAKFGAAPLLDSFSGSATTSNTARPASEASYRSESSYRPVDTVQQTQVRHSLMYS